MASPVFSHLMGTLALLGLLFVVTSAFLGLQYYTTLQIQQVRLNEVSKAATREIVEMVSLFTLGGGDFSYMYLTLPGALGGQGYNLTLVQEGKFIVLRTSTQVYGISRLTTETNIVTPPVAVVSSPVVVNGIKVTNSILLPVPPKYAGGVYIEGKPVIVAFRSGGTIYIGFAVVYPG